jgi:hypothetical protein
VCGRTHDPLHTHAPVPVDNEDLDDVDVPAYDDGEPRSLRFE